jgi:uncharacterized membrane protein
MLFGFAAAVAVMAAITYLCRISGYALMGLVPLTPRVRRGLAALPGCIIISVILPIADRAGPVAFVGLAAAILVMAWSRRETVALAAGLALVAGLRAGGIS